MSGPIQFGGLASGLDTAAIIDALMGVERLPLFRLETRQSEQQNRLSRVGTLEGLVKDLRTKAKDMAESGDVFEYGLQIGDDSVASIQVSGTPAAGSHSLEVLNLAGTARYSLGNGIVDPTEELVTGPGDGELSFEVDGQLYSIDIEDGAGSLNQIADQINAELGEVGQASVVNTGTETDPSYELVLSSKETGTAAAITNVQVSGLNSGDFSVTSIEDGANAKFILDGLTFERASNTFSDVLDGFSFTLLKEGEDATTTFGSEVDTEGTIDAIKELVKSYNDIADFIAKESVFTEDGGATGVLFGDSLLSNVRQATYSGLFSVNIDDVTSDTTGYSTLGIVGFDLGTDGRITLDEDELAEKLAEDPEAFSNLLTGDRDYNGETVSGVFGQLELSLDSLLEDSVQEGGDSTPDVFEGRRDAINARIKDYGKSIESEERRLEQFEQSLILRYANLEQLMAGLQSQSSFLGGF